MSVNDFEVVCVSGKGERREGRGEAQAEAVRGTGQKGGGNTRETVRGQEQGGRKSKPRTLGYRIRGWKAGRRWKQEENSYFSSMKDVVRSAVTAPASDH